MGSTNPEFWGPTWLTEGPSTRFIASLCRAFPFSLIDTRGERIFRKMVVLFYTASDRISCYPYALQQDKHFCCKNWQHCDIIPFFCMKLSILLWKNISSLIKEDLWFTYEIASRPKNSFKFDNFCFVGFIIVWLTCPQKYSWKNCTVKKKGFPFIMYMLMFSSDKACNHRVLANNKEFDIWKKYS